MDDIIKDISNLFIENEEEEMLKIIKNTFNIYLKNGSRSSEKVKYLHENIKKIIEKTLPKEYDVKIEYSVKSFNCSGKKKCDIVIFKNNEIYSIFPIKFIMSNYLQNRNNSWENLTGECLHLYMANKNVKIIPINFIYNSVPYLNLSKKIIKFENINYNSFEHMKKLLDEKICYSVITYIIDVEQISIRGEKYEISPKILGFNKKTPYIEFNKIFGYT